MILISLNAFIAQNTVEDIQSGMNDSYNYHLVFKKDGKTTHYDVMRYNSSEYGEITLTYYTSSNQLEVTKVSNIKELEINVKSMFKDESLKVFKRPYDTISNMDMLYWLDAGEGIFTVTFDIDSNEPMEKLTFTEFPEPTSVLVDNREWWKTSLNYSIDGEEIIITNIPTGETTVIFDFNKPNEIPIPLFLMNPDKKAGVNQEIAFNASISYDIDGEIIHWLWDFGDGSADSGPVVRYQYSKPGTYIVKLTVRDNSEPYAEASLGKNIVIEYGADQDNDNDGKGDKLPDWWEWEHFENLDYGPNDDPDGDGYSNGLEHLADSNPMDNTDFVEDSDEDGLPDSWEWDYFRSLAEVPTGDPDNDKATNLEEFDSKTNPLDDKSKPEEPKSDEDEKGMFQMGPQMDLIIILIIIVVIVIITILIVISKGKKKKGTVAVKTGELGAQQPYTQEQPLQQPMQKPQQPQQLQQPQIPQQPAQESIHHAPTQESSPPAFTTSEPSQQVTATTPPTQTQTQSPTQPEQQTAQIVEQPPPTNQQQSPKNEALPVKGPPKTQNQTAPQEPYTYKETETSAQDFAATPSYTPEPVEPVQYIEPVDFEDPIQPDSVEQVESIEPVENLQSNEPVETMKPGELMEPAKVLTPASSAGAGIPAAANVQPQETGQTPMTDSTDPDLGSDTNQDVINQYIRLLGIDLDTAKRIYNAGYVQLDYLILAAVDELSAIEGVGPVTAANIKEKMDNMDKIPGPEGEQSSHKENNSLDIPGEELLDRLNNLKNRINNIEENGTNNNKGTD
jgi:PKD repeat protein